MAHKILVMSPLHNLGQSVVSAFIAQALTFAGNTSTLIYTKNDSYLPQYLGIDGIKDPTRSIMQVVKLVNSGAMEDTSILDYAHMYTKNGYLLNTTDSTLLESDMQSIISHVYSRVPTDIVVCDNSEDITSPITKLLLKESDMLFLVLDMSRKSREWFDGWRENPELKKFKELYVVVNHYDPTISSMREYAAKLKYPAVRVCKIHESPWITKCANTSTLQTILPLARDLDPRVAVFNDDIGEIIQAVKSSIFLALDKG